MSLDADYQGRCGAWTYETVGKRSAESKPERALRFLEEALELAQAAGVYSGNAMQLVQDVYERPAGLSVQEVGGVMLTLGAYCDAAGINLTMHAERELERVQDPLVKAKVRARQREKRHQFT